MLGEKEDDVKPPLERAMWGSASIIGRSRIRRAALPPIYSTMPGELCCKPALMVGSSSFLG